MSKAAKRRAGVSDFRWGLVGILLACGPAVVTQPDGGAGGGDASSGGGGAAGGGSSAGGGSFGTGGGSSTGGGNGTGGGSSVGGGSAAGGGQSGTGGGSGDGAFCAPCVESSDCAPGALCLGYPGHCGADCSQGQACATGSTCDGINLGKAPAGTQCTPTVAACGSLDTVPPNLDCSDTWSSFADAFFGNNCRTCHSGWLMSPSDVTSDAQAIRMVIESHDMPPPYAQSTLTDADRLRLLTWMECGGTPSSSPPTGPVAH
jgi:hypothetical protein